MLKRVFQRPPPALYKYIFLTPCVCAGRKARAALERAGKIIYAGVAQRLRDRADRAVVAAQRGLGLFYAQLPHIGHGAHAVQLGEQLAEVHSGIAGQPHENVVAHRPVAVIGDVLGGRQQPLPARSGHIASFSAARSLAQHFVQQLFVDQLTARFRKRHFPRQHTGQPQRLLAASDRQAHHARALRRFRVEFDDRAVPRRQAAPDARRSTRRSRRPSCTPSELCSISSHPPR